MTKIDYEKLNKQIVEQAYETAFGEMTKEQLQKLIQDKFERAKKYHEALAKAPTFSVNQPKCYRQREPSLHSKHGQMGGLQDGALFVV